MVTPWLRAWHWRGTSRTDARRLKLLFLDIILMLDKPKFEGVQLCILVNYNYAWAGPISPFFVSNTFLRIQLSWKEMFFLLLFFLLKKGDSRGRSVKTTFFSIEPHNKLKQQYVIIGILCNLVPPNRFWVQVVNTNPRSVTIRQK